MGVVVGFIVLWLGVYIITDTYSIWATGHVVADKSNELLAIFVHVPITKSLFWLELCYSQDRTFGKGVRLIFIWVPGKGGLNQQGQISVKISLDKGKLILEYVII